MEINGMCHGGNQYINLIKDAFDVRNNVKYHHVSYIISYRIAFSKHISYTDDNLLRTDFQ